MPRERLLVLVIAGAWFFSHASVLTAKNPVQKANNTITLRVSEPIEPLSFSQPIKFHLQEVVDRTGNSPPNLVLEKEGGIYVSPEPREIIRQRVADSLRAAGLLAPDAASADYLLTVYLVHFGHERGIGKEFFFKVGLNISVGSAHTPESEKISALGTSLTWGKKNIQVNMENALVKALRSFLRGAPFGEAVKRLQQLALARQAAAAAEAAEKEAAEAASRAKEAAARESPGDAKPPPQEPGIVLVSSTPEGGEVFVDEGFVGNTPARVKLSSGKHTVRVVMAGQEDWVRQLSVLPGSELKVSVVHTPKAPPPEPSAPNPKALSKQEILGLLTDYVPNARIAALVKERGIKFTPTQADLNEIADAGGDDDLVEVLRKAAPSKP
jgi:ribosomal protein L12E/L44/L45/RPP1/RPP2